MRRRHRSNARWAAPAALVAAFAAVVMVLGGGGDEEPQVAPGADEPAATTPERTTERPETTEDAPAEEEAAPAEDGPATYTIQPGDTLSAIAAETGVSIEELQELNPDANSSALTVGDTLRLREGGE